MAPGRLSVWSWVLYDLANTIFALGVIGRYFPEWLTSVGQPDSALALVEAGAGALVIFLAPWAGARSDVRRHQGSDPGGDHRSPAWPPPPSSPQARSASTLALLGLALIAFNVGSVVYDAFSSMSAPRPTGPYLRPGCRCRIRRLVHRPRHRRGDARCARLVVRRHVSWCWPLPSWCSPCPPSSSSTNGAVMTTRRSQSPGTSPEGWRPHGGWPAPTTASSGSWSGRFLYTDAINTLIGGFLTIFVIQELGLDGQFTTRLLGVAIASAIVGAFVAGRLVERFGPMRVLRAVLVLWMVAIGAGIAAAVTGETGVAWAIGPLGGSLSGRPGPRIVW